MTTVETIIERLRQAATPDVRELADVDRNAMLWLSVLAGIPRDESFFALAPRPTLDEERFSDSAYLAAIGFAIAAGAVKSPSAAKLRSRLAEIMRRSPHTVELSGYADDPLSAVGLALLAARAGRGDLAKTIREHLVDRVGPSPALNLIAAASDMGGKWPDAPAASPPAWLAATVIARKIASRMSNKSVPSVDLSTVIERLRSRAAEGSYAAAADIESMLVLAALQVARAELDRPSPLRVRRVRRRQSVLFLAANPLTTTHLALDEEARDIEAKIRAAKYRNELHLRHRWAVRADDLLQALNEDRPTIVHFSGHGTGAAGIVLHDDSGGHHAVSGAALRALFTAFKDDVRVVVLSACYSKEQAVEIATVIDCVVGMRSSVGDVAARKFAAGFYRALGFGRDVRNAFEQGIVAMHVAGLSDIDVPELVVRPGVDPGTVRVVGAASNTRAVANDRYFSGAG